MNVFDISNHYWSWNGNGEEVKFKIRESVRKERKAPRSKAQKKQKLHETDKIRKDATDSRERACSGRL